MSRSGRHSNLFKHNIIEDNRNEVAITSKRIAEDLEQPRPCKRTRSEPLLNTSIESLDTLSQSSDSSFSNLTSDFSSPGSFTTFDYNSVDSQVIYPAPAQAQAQAPVQENNFTNLNHIESEYRELALFYANPVAEFEASNNVNDFDMSLIHYFFSEFDFQFD